MTKERNYAPTQQQKEFLDAMHESCLRYGYVTYDRVCPFLNNDVPEFLKLEAEMTRRSRESKLIISNKRAAA